MERITAKVSFQTVRSVLQVWDHRPSSSKRLKVWRISSPSDCCHKLASTEQVLLSWGFPCWLPSSAQLSVWLCPAQPYSIGQTFLKWVGERRHYLLFKNPLSENIWSRLGWGGARDDASFGSSLLEGPSDLHKDQRSAFSTEISGNSQLLQERRLYSPLESLGVGTVPWGTRAAAGLLCRRRHGRSPSGTCTLSSARAEFGDFRWPPQQPSRFGVKIFKVLRFEPICPSSFLASWFLSGACVDRQQC